MVIQSSLSDPVLTDYVSIKLLSSTPFPFLSTSHVTSLFIIQILDPLANV